MFRFDLDYCLFSISNFPVFLILNFSDLNFRKPATPKFPWVRRQPPHYAHLREYPFPGLKSTGEESDCSNRRFLGAIRD